MGQYHYIINLDKKQYLHPHNFNEGLKLLEFGSGSTSIMTALAVLLSDNNGAGGGDLYRTEKRKGIASAPPPWKPLPSNERVISEFFVSSGWWHRLIVPKLAGSWAGDRIVVGGDYADTTHLTKAQIRYYKAHAPAIEIEGFAKDWKENPDRYSSREVWQQRLDDQLERIREGRFNVHKFAERFFENISFQALEMICKETGILDEWAERLVNGSVLLSNIPPCLKSAIAKKKRDQIGKGLKGES